ncbi:MAG TPA: ABC transporter permease [Spongiibacteraceae bacterium]|jgi:putative ABC transport system permease protein
MKYLLLISLKSFRNRKASVGLSIAAILVSVVLFTGVLYVRAEAKQWFVQTISGTDLIVGARSGPVNLLLYAVFRIGDATNNISWQSYRDIADDPEVAWTIPLSLGDSHRGYRVLGTNLDYFKYLRYGNKQPLELAQGLVFHDLYDAVIGAEVADALHYKLGQEIVLAHGAGKISFVQHADKPFRVVGILKRTGTPVDRTVHVSLEAIEAIHVDWQSGMPAPGQHIDAEAARQRDLSPKLITAFLLGMHSKIATFQMQRTINEYPDEPLLAILPGVALAQLWQVMAVMENILQVIAGFVVLTGMTGLLITLLSTLNERRREMAVLRSVGAGPKQIFFLFVFEAFWIAAAACSGAVFVLYALLALARPAVQSATGVALLIQPLAPLQWLLLGAVIVLASLLGLVPGVIAYRHALHDGLTMRV